MAEDRPVGPLAGAPCSMTVTSTPRDARWNAALAPWIPAPMMAGSAGTDGATYAPLPSPARQSRVGNRLVDRSPTGRGEAAAQRAALPVREVGAVTDPLGGCDRQQVRHLVDHRGVLRAKIRELLPAGVVGLEAITRFGQALHRLLVLVLLDDRLARALETEEPAEVFDQVIAHREHEPRRTYRVVLDSAHHENGRVHDRAERVDPRLVVMRGAEIDQQRVGEVALKDHRRPLAPF